MRSGVEVADAALPGGLEHRPGLLVGHRPVEVADVRGPVAELIHGSYLGPRAGGRGRQIAAAANLDRSDEVLVQMVDELDDAAVHGSGDRHEVEHRQVLHGLAQADAARVRAHGHAELVGEQEDRHVLVDAGDAGRVDLQDLQRLRLEELLEHDAVGHVLAGRDRHRDAAGDRGVTEHVVGVRGLLDPGEVVGLQRAHPLDRFAGVPALVGVHGDAMPGPRLTGDPQPATSSSTLPRP